MHRKEKQIRWKESVLFFSVLFCFLMLSAKGFAQEKKVSLSCKEMPLSEALTQIERQSEYKLNFNYDELNQFKVTVNIKKESIQNVILTLLKGLPYQMKVNGKFIIIYRRTIQRQQPRNIPRSGGAVTVIRGRVVDDSDKPLPGVNISFKDHNYGATTDASGYYTVTVDRGGREIMLFSFIGMKTQVIPINCNGDEKTLDVTMKEGNSQLNEVVVTGIFNKPKASFTGAATIVTQEQIKAQGNRNLLKTLSNIDPSFDLQENNMKGSDPNQTLNIEIRGSSTIGNVTELQSNVRNERNLPLFILDGFEVTSERVMDMNQDDVESVVILKDASATAIYGSRGSNGVVVISSKRPELGRLRVSYSMGLNLEIPNLSSYNLMNSFEKLDVEKAAGLYTNTTLSNQLQLNELYNQNLKAANEGVNTDWIRIPVRVGVGQFHKLDLSGGIDQFRYILNFSYNQLTGAMKGSKRDNLNGNMIISYLMKKVRFTNNLSLGFNNTSDGSYGRFSLYAGMNPYWRPYDEHGDPIMYYRSLASSQAILYNPLYDAAQTSFSNSDYTNVRNTTMLDMDLLPGLRVNASIGFTQQRGGYDSFISPKSSTFLITSTDAASRGSYTQKEEKKSSYQISATASWAKVFGEHSIYLGANYQMMENKSNLTSVSVKGFMNDKMTDISNGNLYQGSKPATNESTVRSMGYTGTINYNYAQKYFVDASYREDAASSFGSQSRWAPFWSIGLGWEIANEKWVSKHLSFINQAKFRYSYGVTGSLNFSPYDALMTYKYNNDIQYNYLIGASINSFGNPNLKWQNTKEHNFGLDLNFVNRFILNFNFYRKTTDNLLSDSYLPFSHGYSSYKENIGQIRNTGYDLSVSYKIIRYSLHRQIDWSVRAGVYHNSNILVKLSDAIKKANEQYSSTFSGSALLEYREGQSLDELYVLRSAGVDPLTGKRLYIANDGTVTTNVSGIDKVAVGNGQPKINGRLGTGFRWKGLNVDLSFGFRLGGKKLNSTLLNKVENAVVTSNQDRRVITGRWRKPGDITPYKSLSGTADNSFPNDLFVFTENTFTFNNASIAYDFPLSWIKNLGMSRLSLTGSLSDIFYISNIKQERGTDYPYSIKPTFSLSCTF